MESKNRKKQRVQKILNLTMTGLLLAPAITSVTEVTTVYAVQKDQTDETTLTVETSLEDSTEATISSQTVESTQELPQTSQEKNVKESQKTESTTSESTKKKEKTTSTENKSTKENKQIDESAFSLTIHEQKAELLLKEQTNINDVYKYSEELQPITHLVINGKGSFDETFAQSNPLVNLETLEAPTIQYIPGKSFKYGKLKELKLPNVTIIENQAFEKNQLKSIDLPKVIELKNTVFNENQLTEIKMPKIEKIGQWVFRSNQLTEISLPSLRSTYQESFGYNPLKTVYFPNAATVSTDAFKGATELKKVTIGLDDNQTLQNVADIFSDWKDSLEDLTVTNLANPGKYRLETAPFTGWKIPKIHFPMLIKVDEHSFSNMDVGTLDLPMLRNVEKNILVSSALKKLVIPITLGSMDIDAFQNSQLELVTYPKEKEQLLTNILKKQPEIIGIVESKIENQKIEIGKAREVPILTMKNEQSTKAELQVKWEKNGQVLSNQQAPQLSLKKASAADQGTYQGSMKVIASTGEQLFDYQSNSFYVSVGAHVDKPKVDTVNEQSTELTGSGIAGAVIEAKVSGKEIGSGKVQTNGTYSIKIPKQKKGSEINISQIVGENESEEVSIEVAFLVEMEVIPRGVAYDNKMSEQRKMQHATMEPTGIFLPKDAEVTITLSEEPEAAYVKIGQYGAYLDNPYVNKDQGIEFVEAELHKGKNVLKREDSGGMVYIDNRSYTQKINVSVEGGIQVPYYIQGITPLEEFKKQLQEQPNVPFLEVVSENTMGTFQLHRSKDVFGQDNRVNELLDYWELVYKLQNEVSGLSHDVKGVNKKYNNRLHIVNTDIGAGTAFASNYRVTVFPDSDRDLLTHTKDDDQWLIWHEAGHMYQNPYYKWTGIGEVTVNIQSEYIRQKLFGTNRIDDEPNATNIREFLSSPIEQRDFDALTDNYIRLAMFWILQRVFGDDFYPALNQSYRALPADQLPETDHEMKQMFMKMTSKLVRRNLAPYFKEFGMKLDEETEKELSQYPDLEKEIWRDVGFGERHPIPGLIQKYSVPTADIDEMIVPIFTPAEQLKENVQIKNAHSIPIESPVSMENMTVTYTDYGPNSQAQVWLKNELGYEDKIPVKITATPGDTVRFRGNHSGQLILGPDPQKKKFQMVVKTGQIHSQYQGEEYYQIALFNRDLSKEKGKVIANGETKTEDFAKEVEKLTYEVGDVVRIYHAESSNRLDRYLQDKELEPNDAQVYLYRITKDGWEALINPAAPQVNQVLMTDKVITGTGEPGAQVVVKSGDKELGKGTVKEDANFSIAIKPQVAKTKLQITQTIADITSPKTEIAVEGVVDIESDLIAELVAKQVEIEMTHTFTATQISKITSLDLNDNERFAEADLADIAKLTSLTKLYLDNLGIRSLEPLAKLAQLETLSVKKNQIKTLAPLKSTTSLKELIVGENNITDLSALKDLTGLTKLWINSNQLTSVAELENLTKMVSLDLRYNQIENIQALSKMKELEGIWLSANKLTDLSPLPNLAIVKEAKNQMITVKEQPNQAGTVTLPNAITIKDVAERFGGLTYDISNKGNYDEQKDQFIWTDVNIYQLTYTFTSGNGLYTGTITIPITGKEDKITLDSDLIAELVSKQLKIEMTHEFTKEQLSKIQQLDLTNSQRFVAADLKDIAKLTNLNYLYLKNLKIKSLEPLETLTRLEGLSIEGAQVESLAPVKKMTRLKELVAIKNNITDLEPLKELTELTKLWINSNQVTSVTGLEKLNKMTSLDLGYNQIEDIQALSNMKQLNEVWLNGNKLGNLSPIPDLKAVKDAKNQEITIKEQPNQAGTVTLPNPVTIKDVAESFGGLTYNIRDKGNYDEQKDQFIWTDVSKYELTYTFTSRNGLYTGSVTIPITGKEDKITLDSDLIAELVSKQLKIEMTHEFTKEQLSRIQQLDLTNNQRFVAADLKDVAKLTNLNYLYLKNLNIQSIAPLETLTRLEGLSIEGAQVESLAPLKKMPRLKELVAIKNNITNLEPLKELTELTKLWISSNQLTSVTSLEKLTKMTSLDLGYNQIEDIQTLSNMKQLNEVWLNGNKLSDLSPIPDLKVVKEAKNQTILLKEQPIQEGTLTLANAVMVKGVAENFAGLSYEISDDGSYDEKKDQFIWADVSNYELTYTFTSGNGLYTGRVTIPILGRTDKVTLDSDLVAELVSNQLKVDLTHTFSKKQLSKITSLSLSSNERFAEPDLKDVAKLENLRSLSLDNLAIKTLEYLSPLTRVEMLTIRNNKIQNLAPLKRYKKLIELYATTNEINDISGVENLSKLKKFWAGNNQISSLKAVSNLVQLESLSLERNQIADVTDLSKLNGLTELYLYNNQISDLSPISEPAVIKDARNQTITLNKQKVTQGKVTISNAIQLKGLTILGAFSAVPSNDGQYDTSQDKVIWSELNEAKLPKSLSYSYTLGDGKIYSGKVIVPIGLEVGELPAPEVAKVFTEDTKVTGKGVVGATLKVQVNDITIGQGIISDDGNFEVNISPQAVGTKLMVSQTFNGENSPVVEVIVEAPKATAYNQFKLGYWKNYGFILEGQAGINGQQYPNKGDVTKTVELVDVVTDETKVTAKAANTNWYTPGNYDGYQGILTNEMLDTLTKGNYRIDIVLTSKDGQSIRQPLSTKESIMYDFTGDYRDKLADLGTNSVFNKKISFSEGFGQVQLTVAEEPDQPNILNSRVNASGDNVVDFWIASTTYDFRTTHTKYLVIKDANGKEVYHKKAPTWDIKKTFKKQVKAEWEKSGVQAIIPKKFKDTTFTKEIHVLDEKEQIQITIEIPKEFLK